MYIINQYFCCI